MYSCYYSQLAELEQVVVEEQQPQNMEEEHLLYNLVEGILAGEGILAEDRLAGVGSLAGEGSLPEVGNLAEDSRLAAENNL